MVWDKININTCAWCVGGIGRACTQARTHAHVHTCTHCRLTQAPTTKNVYYSTHTHTDSHVRTRVQSCSCTRARTHTFVHNLSAPAPSATHCSARACTSSFKVFMFAVKYEGVEIREHVHEVVVNARACV